jgi:hypothetical protein
MSTPSSPGRYGPPADPKKPWNQSLTVEFSVQAIDCLKCLQRTGLYGHSLEEVTQRLVEERLRGMVPVKWPNQP